MTKTGSDSMPADVATRVAADVGGTFTDLVVIDAGGAVRRHKVLSTPPDFDVSVLEGIGAMASDGRVDVAAVGAVNHGTTVATNAILERRGARTALVTTKGFRDVLELRRIRAPQIYDLFFVKPPTIVERHLRFEVDERMAADGTVLAPVREDDLRDIVSALTRMEVESVGVCLLHSYAHPAHEQEVGRYLRAHLPTEVTVSLSCEVLAQRREYERSATTAVNAYVRPVMRRYLDRLREGLSRQGIDAPLLIMQSAGGLTTAENAAARPVFSLESGPAAGVLASAWSAESAGHSNVISFDMGGTTAKAAMIEQGRVPYSREYEVGSTVSAGNRLVGGGGDLILAPSIDIAEVGAGGGSIAYLDAAGGLQVGPRSAGAVPGPACYQRGGVKATVTDANVILGYIRPAPLADGDVVIDRDAACAAVEREIAKPLDMPLSEAALGIHRIANAQMLRALREVSTHRGRDPRQFTLVAFGGSGPVHAAGLARDLGVQRVIVPPMPGVFSAVGLLVCGIEHHEVRSCRLAKEGLTPEAIGAHVRIMRDRLESQFTAQSLPLDRIEFLVSLDLQYVGQTSQLRVDVEEPLDEAVIARAVDQFETEHERLYGYRAAEGTGVEALAVRLIGRVPAPGTQILSGDDGLTKQTVGGSRCADFGAPWGEIETTVSMRRALGDGVEGPLLIDEYDTTIVIPPDFTAATDSSGNVVMTLVNSAAPLASKRGSGEAVHG